MAEKNIGCECIESYPAELEFGNFLQLWMHYKAATELLTTTLVSLAEIGIDCSQKCSQKARGPLAKKARGRGIYIYQTYTKAGENNMFSHTNSNSSITVIL